MNKSKYYRGAQYSHQSSFHL